MEYLKIAAIALIVILIAKFLFHFDGKKLVSLIVNAIVGLVVLWLINLTWLITLPINIITCLLVGIFGLPGVILLIILVLIGII